MISNVFQIDPLNIIGLKDNKNNVYDIPSFISNIRNLNSRNFDLIINTNNITNNSMKIS